MKVPGLAIRPGKISNLSNTYPFHIPQLHIFQVQVGKERTDFISRCSYLQKYYYNLFNCSWLLTLLLFVKAL